MTQFADLSIVGFDGVSPNIYRRFLSEMPNFRSFLEEGGGGTLSSTVPPITGPAWTTMMTGKEPGNHGVFDMVTPDSSYGQNSLSASHDEPAIYDYVDNSVNINVPGAYPRTPAGDALLVYSFDCPTAEQAIPPELADLDSANSYVVSNPKESFSDTTAYIEQLREIEKTRFEFLQETFRKRGDTEFAFTLFSGTDWALHQIESLDGPEGEAFGRLLSDIDGYLGWIQERSRNTVVMSDHGFERKETTLSLPYLLEQGEFLTADSSDSAGESVVDRVLGTAAQTVNRLSQHSATFRQAVQWIATSVLDDKTISEVQSSWDRQIIWSETEAFPMGYQGIYINVEELFNEGIVPESKVDEIREEIISYLWEMEVRSDRRLFSDIHDATDLYHGDYVESSPDIVISPAEGVSTKSAFNVNERWINAANFYDHRRDGIFACRGPAFSSESADRLIVDITPTALAVLGYPIPNSMDGQPIEEVLAADVEPERKEVDESFEYDWIRESGQTEVKERLEQLGYLE